MSKEVAWCQLKKRKCFKIFDDWHLAYAGDDACDCCKMYEREEQRYGLYKGVQIPIQSDFCKHLTTKMCGRNKI